MSKRNMILADVSEVLQTRYPELSFLLNYSSIEEELVDTLDAQIDLSAIEVVYLLGLALLPASIQIWLRAHPNRRLIVLEDRLSVLAAFVKQSEAAAFLLDPQIKITWLYHPQQLDKQLDQCIDEVPSLCIEVIASAGFALQRPSWVKKVRLALLRKSAVSDAQMKEVLYAHRLLENVMPNIRRWPTSFLANRLKGKFKNIPAIICGAGPSLNDHLPQLKTLEDRALIIAGGSAITALSNQGLVPHLGLVLDPNPEEYERLRLVSAFEMPLLYGTRVRKEVFNTTGGPWGYIQSWTGGPCELYFEQQLGFSEEPIGPELGEEAFSVTTLAIALAAAMGCHPIIFSGIDLAYTGMQRYAKGVMPSSAVLAPQLKAEKRSPDRWLRRKNEQGKMVSTQVRWVMESAAIAAYAKFHPHIQWINASAQSLGFDGIPYQSLQEVAKLHLQHSFDLRAKLHQQIQMIGSMPIDPDAIQAEIADLPVSLRRLEEICASLLQEIRQLQAIEFDPETAFPTGKMTLLQLDFEEEKAFPCFFAHAGPAIDRYVNRCHPLPFNGDPSDMHRATLTRLAAKWEYIGLQCQAMRNFTESYSDY